VGEGEQKKSLDVLLEEALVQYTPLDLINTVLLDGMKNRRNLFRRAQDAASFGA